MKTRICRVLAVLVVICMLSNSCAHFRPTSFPIYEPKDYPFQAENDKVSFAVGNFTHEEVKIYFASDLIKKNIWPVRVRLVNKSEKTYLFSKGMIKPKVASSHLAARQGRKSVGHRVFWGYVLILTFFGIPLGVPLVVGGFQAMGANSHMESAYARYEIQDLEMKPGDALSGILFFHQPDLPDTIEVLLIDSQTDQKLNLTVGLTEKMMSMPSKLPSVTPDAIGKVELMQ